LWFLVAVARNAARAKSARFAARSLAVALTAIFLAILGVWIATHVLITRPVRTLVRIARRRQAGDTSARFRDLRTTAEFGQLSAALSHMSDRVDDLLAQKALFLRE